MPNEYMIKGIITAADGAVPTGMKIQALDRDLPSLERRSDSPPRIVGEAATDAEGRFQISYLLEQFQSGDATSPFRRVREKNADLSFRIFDMGGRELSIDMIEAGDRKYRADQIIFNVPSQLEEVTIFLDSPQAAGTSEFQQLMALLAPVLDDFPISQLSDEDIAFLSHEFGLEQQPEVQHRIDWLRRSALLAQLAKLPVEAFYGWGREDVPARFVELALVPLNDLPTILKKLRSLETLVLRAALLAAIDDNIIFASLKEQIEAIVRQLGRSNQMPRVVTVHLTDADTGLALAGHTVTTLDRTEAEEDLGLDITDSQGRFAVSFYSPSDLPADAPPRKFFVRLEAVDGEDIPEAGPVDIRPDGADTDVVEVRINIFKPPRPSLQDQLQEVQIATPELITYFNDHAIETFADIRSKGGIHRLVDLPRLAPDTLQQLASLVDLDRLSLTVAASTALIKNRYDSVLAIADAPHSEFVNAVTGSHTDLSELGARKLHVMAHAQTSLLNNLLVEMANTQANGFTL